MPYILYINFYGSFPLFSIYFTSLIVNIRCHKYCLQNLQNCYWIFANYYSAWLFVVQNRPAFAVVEYYSVFAPVVAVYYHKAVYSYTHHFYTESSVFRWHTDSVNSRSEHRFVSYRQICRFHADPNNTIHFVRIISKFKY